MKRFLTLSIIVLLATAAWSAKTAQAIWTAGNTTLTFTYEEPVSVGGTYGGQTVTAVWSGMDVAATGVNDPGWLTTVKGSLTTVVFKSAFKEVKPISCSNWFYNCGKLTTIKNISNLTTTNVMYMDCMFRGCSSLTLLNLSSFNTENVTSMQLMFNGCSSLTSLNLSSFNTTKVTSMYNLFYGCSSLTSLNLSSFNTANVTDMLSMFSGCSSLTSLDISSFNTANVTDMHWMFNGCSSLTSLDLSSFNTTNVTSMYCMFHGCSSLTSLDLSSFNTAKVTDMGSMFSGCSSLTSLNLSSFNTAKVTSMEYMFYGCSSLTSLNLSSFNTTNVTSMEYMFCGCSSLNSLNLSSFNTTNVTNMRGMFQGCSSLTSLNLSSFNTTNVTNMYWMFNGCSSLTSLNLSSFNTAKVTNMGRMFNDCSSLTSLNLSSFNTAKVIIMREMFRYCTSLKNLDLSSFNTSSVDASEYMFNSVPAQCFVYMPTGTLSSIKSQRSKNLVLMDGSTWTCANCEMTPDTEYDIWYQFKATALSVPSSSATAYCLYKDGAMYKTLTSLANVTIPKGKDKISETFPAMAIWTAGNTTLTFLVSDSYKAGDTYNNQTITNVWKGSTVSASATTPAWLETVQGTMTKVVFASSFKYVKPTTCRNWFYKCGKLATITGIGNLNTSEVTTMLQMFRECTSLTSLNLSTFDTQKVTTMRCMFYGCTGLTSLNLTGFNTAATTDMGYMFYGCSELTSLDVTNFNTAKVTTMTNMFRACSKLTSLDVTNFNTAAVTDMSTMFFGCSGLTSLDLSNFNTAKVTTMLAMFQGCSKLTSLDVTNFNTAKVTTMENMFRGCSKLTSIDAYNFSYDALTTYTNMFTSVPELCFVYMRAGMPDDLKSQKPKNLVLRSGNKWTCDNCWMTFDKTYDILYAFTATSLTADGTDATSVALYNNDVPFAAIYNFANESIPYGPDRLSDYSGPQVVWTAGNTTLTFISSENLYGADDAINGETVTDVWINFNTGDYSVPKWLSTVQGTLTHVVFDDSFASYLPPSCSEWFANCGQLTTVSGWENLRTSECVSFLAMFYGCEKLENVDVSHFETSNCIRFQNMFQRCSSLTSIDVSNFDTSNATSIGGMFAYCTGLTELDLRSFNTENVTDFGWLVRGCTSLRSLDLSNFNTAKQKGNQDFFENVSDKCFIFIPEGQWEMFNQEKTDNLVLKKSDGTFDCDHCVLADGETLTLPYGFKALDGVTYERNIAANNGNGYTVFLPYDCPIPEGVTAYTLRTDEQSLLDEDKIVFAPIEGDVLEAYNPYLLVNSGNDLTNLNTTVDTQVLPTTTATAEKTFGDMRFTGTMRTISNEEAAEMGAYIMQTGCRWKKVMTSSPTAYIPAYRAYLISPSGEAQTRATLFDGTTVGIDPVAASGRLPADDDNIYDLQGRCVATKGQWSVANGQLSIATGKLPKGVYITNGHRYVVK